MIAELIKQKTMAPVKSNKFQGTITFGQLIGVGFSIIASIVIFVIMVNVRLSNLENNQAGLKEQYNDFGIKMDKFIDKQNEKFDNFTETLNDIKVMLHDKVDKK